MADVEIELARADDRYSVVVREIDLQSEVIREPRRGVARFEPMPPLESAEYGAALFQALFASESVRREWERITDNRAGNDPLQVRLMIDRSASELHALAWERLHGPGARGPLLHDENLLFSRFLFSTSEREPVLRERERLRALVFIADPEQLGDGSWVGASAIDAAHEEARVRAALGDMPTTVVTSQPGRPASLETLIAALREDVDVLYLVCHGAGADDRADARVFLEDHLAPGKVKVVRVGELAVRLGSLRRLPTLALLSSCESAGAVGALASPLSGLGPQLIEAGVMAVVAMQGRISMATASEFATMLFAQLREHGNVAQAVAVARNICATSPDAWMPVLFSRLRRGTIWYERGFAATEIWADLVGAIKKGQLVPLIGPDLMRPILGSPDSLAREFAEGFLSRAPQEWADLPRIAQLRSKINSREVVHADLERLLRQHAADRVDVPVHDPRTTPELLKTAWEKEAASPGEPHAFLAGLPLRIFITTNIDDSLSHALRAKGKTPTVSVFRWNNRMGRDELNERRLPVQLPNAPTPQPTVQQPLVFHLFGHIDDPASLVVSEDDFFDYLMWCRLPASEIPLPVEYAWKTFPLIFLGFHVDDWRFRVMFRSILNEHRRDFNDTRWKSVAASVAPEESGVLPMRRYLQNYFGGAKIETYWGPVTEFLKELAAAWASERAR